MADLAELFIAMLEKLEGIQETLNDVSDKLDNINGTYGLDNIHAAIDDAANKITGPLNYNLQDIHNDLSNQ